METSEIKRITADDVWAMFLKSWDLVKFNYGLTLVMSFCLGVGMVFSTIPTIGPLIAATVMAFAPLVFLKAAQQWENGKESNANELIDVLKNKTLLKRMAPLMMIQVVASATPPMIAQIPYLNVLFGGIGILAIPVQAVVAVAFPILYFNSELPYQKSISLALDGVVKNIGPFFIATCISIALLVVTAIFMLIPLFVIGLPVVFVFQYLWYRVVYEGLEVEIPDKAII